MGTVFRIITKNPITNTAPEVLRSARLLLKGKLRVRVLDRLTYSLARSGLTRTCDLRVFYLHILVISSIFFSFSKGYRKLVIGCMDTYDSESMHMFQRFFRALRH